MAKIYSFFKTELFYISNLIKNTFGSFIYGNKTIEEIIGEHHVINFYYLSAIAWLIVICTLTIITLTIILLRKQRKTQKMLRELNEKLDKLQPTSDPGELNTEDTESAE